MSDNHQKTPKEIDKISGVETTGHEWDGLKELNNPAPRWWVWVFVVTVVWSIGYWVVYPAWPTLSGSTKGAFGWTQYKELQESQSEIMARQAGYLEKFKAASYDDIMRDPTLNAFAMAGGSALFKNNCATCHGSGAQGSKGYPNLNDDDWLWGGTVAAIEQTLKYGIRSGHDEARQSQMPAFGKDGLLSAQQINDVVAYVMTLSSKEEANVSLAGATVFAENCASCHGENGKGGRDFGAPNLTDAIWLYGGDKATIHDVIMNARAGVMPQWSDKLSEQDIRQLAVYVHGLGGGEAEEVKTETETVSETTSDAAPLKEEKNEIQGNNQ